MENFEWLGRQARLGIERGTSRPSFERRTVPPLVGLKHHLILLGITNINTQQANIYAGLFF